MDFKQALEQYKQEHGKYPSRIVFKPLYVCKLMCKAEYMSDISDNKAFGIPYIMNGSIKEFEFVE